MPFAPTGAQAAIAAINAAGGVKGHPLELDVCDDQQNANAAATCARRFVNDSSVIATAGDNNSVHQLTWIPCCRYLLATHADRMRTHDYSDQSPDSCPCQKRAETQVDEKRNAR